MARDLEALLEQTAASPERAVDPKALVTRVRRRRRVRRAAAVGTSLGLLLVAVLAVRPLLLPSVQLGPADGGTQPTASPEPASPASQSPEDGDRDGVVPAIAALPLDERVEVLERFPAEEGTWVRSRLTEAVRERAREDGCAIGAFDDPAALDGRDAVCADEYGEVLLLDETETRIIRALPLPGVPAETLVLTEDTVYCARQGDGGLPDGMLCRVDRASLEARVRVFPSTIDSAFDGTNRWIPPWWHVDDPVEDPSLFQALEPGDDALMLRGRVSSAEVDPVTLELRSVSDDVSGQRCPPPLPSAEITAGPEGNEWTLPVDPGTDTRVAVRVEVAERAVLDELRFEIQPAGQPGPGQGAPPGPPPVWWMVAGEDLAAGTHELELRWDGTDHAGTPVTAGRYQLFAAAAERSLGTPGDPCARQAGTRSNTGFGLGYLEVTEPSG
jgi:hypothetical protein